MQRGIISGMAMFFCIFMAHAGCAGLTESARGIAGVSTKVLEDGRKNAVRRSYPVDYAKCREIVNGVLADSKVYVYARKDAQKMIAFYLSETDTTPVGIFFTAQGEASTEVAVSSPSRHAKELILDKVERAAQEPAGAASPVVLTDQGNGQASQ
jgi:hypothetical protein